MGAGFWDFAILLSHSKKLLDAVEGTADDTKLILGYNIVIKDSTK